MNPEVREPQVAATVREARARYFAENDLADGGYDDPWVELRTGPFTIRFPNTAARVAAVKLHDLHHLATGYETTWVGEGEIGAWEIAGGCGRHVPAWILNLQALAIGTALAPSRMWRAFLRGSSGRTLYHGDRVEDWLDRPLDDLRSTLVRPAPAGAWRTALPAHLAWTTLALLSLAATIATCSLPLVLAAWILRWLAAS